MRIIKQRTVNIAVIFLSIYYMWYFLPYIRISFNSQLHKYLFFGCFVIGTGVLFINNFVNLNRKVKLTFNILIPIIMYMAVITVFVLYDFLDASKHIRISFTFWGTALVYYLMSYNPSMQRSFGKFLILLFVVNIITSFIGVYTNASAARALTNVSKSAEALEEDIFLSKKNISSIYLFQCLVVVTPFFVYMIKKKFKIVWASIALLFIFLAILKASFTISLILFIFAIALSLIYVKGWLGKVLIVLSAFVLLFLPWGMIFGYLADSIDNSYISDRLKDISIYFLEGNLTGGLAARSELYLSSFYTFIMNPLGIGPHYSYVMFESGIGYHSQILDDLARYGVFALAFYIVFLSQYYKLLKKQWKKINMEETVFVMFIVYLGFITLNLAFRSSVESVVILFILPVLPDIILNKSNVIKKFGG